MLEWETTGVSGYPSVGGAGGEMGRSRQAHSVVACVDPSTLSFAFRLSSSTLTVGVCINSHVSKPI